MNGKKRQLTDEEYKTVEKMTRKGYRVRDIAVKLNRSASTITKMRLRLNLGRKSEESKRIYAKIENEPIFNCVEFKDDAFKLLTSVFR